MTVRREVTGVLVTLVAAGGVLLALQPAVGLAVLAGCGAALLLRPRARSVLAGVMTLLGVAVGVLGASRSEGPLVAAGLAVTLAAAVATVRSPRWPPPERAARSDGHRSPSSRDTWEALDRGEDPTR